MQKTLQTGELRHKKFRINQFISRRQHLIVELISGAFIVLFVYTGINKLYSIENLLEVLPRYPLLAPFADILAWGLPIVELAVSALLFIPRARLAGLYCSLILMSLFTVYLFYMLTFTDAQPCTCGGMLQEMSWPQHVVFNIFFIVLACAGIKLHRKERVIANKN